MVTFVRMSMTAPSKVFELGCQSRGRRFPEGLTDVSIGE